LNDALCQHNETVQKISKKTHDYHELTTDISS